MSRDEPTVRRVELTLTPELQEAVEGLARPGENIFEASRRIFREAVDTSGREAWKRGFHDAMDAVRGMTLRMEHELDEAPAKMPARPRRSSRRPSGWAPGPGGSDLNDPRR